MGARVKDIKAQRSWAGKAKEFATGNSGRVRTA